MPTGPEARRRLGALMEQRRLELGLRWQDVAETGGVSLKALHSARTGNASIRPLTQQAIENGLRWEHGSIQRVLDDADPIPLRAVTGVELADAPEQDREPPADPDMDVTGAVVIAAISPVERQVWEEIHRHPEGSAATVIFTEPIERLLWEFDRPEAERVRMIAALRSVHRRPALRRRAAS
jgi:hypothetical protein